MYITYFLIALIATILGSMAGLGGGVIIKPILDFLGNYNLSTISVLSSVTVFTMAIVSIIKQIRYKFELEIRKTSLIGLGAILGGLLGEKLLKYILQIFNANLVTILQNAILAILLTLVFIYMNNCSFAKILAKIFKFLGKIYSIICFNFHIFYPKNTPYNLL